MASEEPSQPVDESKSLPDYLKELIEAEEEALAKRREQVGELSGPVLPWLKETAVPRDPWVPDDKPGRQPRLGMALSGGGIRSATFCLGILQALARAGRIRYIDYLSTVSGGGYVGSFLGRLFTRSEASLEQGLEPRDDRPPAAGRVDLVEETLGSNSQPVNWLRENGRYLSPNGAGDFCVAAASVLRSWVAIQVVLATFVLLHFVAANVLRCFAAKIGVVGGAASTLAAGYIWWSPYTFVPLLMLAFVAVPLGWAFWPVLGDKPTWWGRHSTSLAVLGVMAGSWIVSVFPGVLEAPLGVVAPGLRLPPGVINSLLVVCVVSGLTLVIYTAGYLIPVWRSPAPKPSDPALAAQARDPETLRDEQRAQIDPAVVAQARRNLTSCLAFTLLAAFAVLLFALVDTLGQTLYAYARGQAASGWTSAAASLFGVCSAVVLFGRKIAELFGGGSRGRWFQLPMEVLASAAAFVLVAAVLVSLNAVSHGIAWGWQIPRSAPSRLVGLQAAADSAYGVEVKLTAGARKAAADNGKYQLTMSSDVTANTGRPASRTVVGDRMSWSWLVSALTLTLLLSLLFSRMWLFLNFSSHQPVYNARIERAYLGASNPIRWTGGGITVLHPVAGDGLAFGDYKPHKDGGPLHFINVTVNETVDGRSMLQQQDRKGVGMAVGPCGVSVGVRHHATWRNEGRQLLPPPYKETTFQVFEDPNQAPSGGYRATLTPEALSVGVWAGISAAAFSTGMGARTKLGLSLLLGFFNVRLGYWWDSGMLPRKRFPKIKRTPDKQFAALIMAVFPVQMYLLDEFTARFHGTARRRWYLSDGGHFENMGAYELIRRRVPLIVVCDGEEDSNYRFEGLANLVRKARTDFHAEIRFLERTELKDYVREIDEEHEEYKDVWKALGSLDDLRRCYAPETGGTAGEPPSSCERKVSRAHAALAEVRYDGSETAGSLLLYIKATLTGDERADVIEYSDNHPDFPHESTIDQFFDESQWESYRKLGDHIGSKLFSIKRKEPQRAPRTPRRPRRPPEPATPAADPPVTE